MSDFTLGSLFHEIAARRSSRLGFARVMEQSLPSERPRWNMQIASFDEAYRRELGAIDELPELLLRVPRLSEGWPYPLDYTIQEVRAELANSMCQCRPASSPLCRPVTLVADTG